MIAIEDWAEMRRLHRSEGVPIKEIARRPGVLKYRYRPGPVSAVPRTAGQVTLITYQGTAPQNPVTGKTGTDAIERYEFWRDGREVVLTLSGPVGADNVDPWRTITDSLQWR